MTLADFKITAGLAPDAATSDRVVDAMRQVYWPCALAGRAGWWWAIGTLDGQLLLAGGWAAGGALDRATDIGRAMLRYTLPGQAVAS